MLNMVGVYLHPIAHYSSRSSLMRRSKWLSKRLWKWSAGLDSQGQVLNPHPRDVIVQPRALINAEVADVLEAARRAVEGRTFRLSYTPGGPGADRGHSDGAGRQTSVHPHDQWTGRPSRDRDVSPLYGDGGP